MSQQVAKPTTDTPGNDPNTPNPSWSNGWYLFEDGKVVGPLQASDAFHRAEHTSSGQPRMVSRKGFTQWYPLKDFAELHAMAGKYADQLAQAKRPPTTNQQAFAQHEPVARPLGPGTHNQTAITPTRDPIAKIQIASQDILNDRSIPQKHNLSRKNRKRLQREEAQARQSTSQQAPHTSQTSSQRRVATFEDQYLLVASRLRLGQQRSPFVSAFVYTLLTIGGYWGAWMARSSEELTWHLSGSSRVNFVLPMWMALIPGVHLYFAWMLARLVAEVELQNGYKTVSPAFATILAMIPPFYMLSLQSAMNRHWRLHVYHSMDRQILTHK